MSLHHSPWPSAASDHDSQPFFPTYDPSSSSASIQINPLSQLPRHPPSSTSSPPPSRSRTTSTRTPRSSVLFSNPNVPPPPLTTKFIKVKPRADVTREEVWREILKESNGRDKALKIIQYSMKVYLLFHSHSARLLGSTAELKPGQLVPRLNSTVAGLSLTRKCLILFNWLTPLLHITHPSSTDIPFASSTAKLTSPTLLHRFLHAPPPVLLDLFNGIADDVYTFSLLGLLGKRVGRHAEKAANWAWFASTLAGLVEIGAERTMVKSMMTEIEARIYSSEVEKTIDPSDADEIELKKLKQQYKWLQVSRMKLIMDLIFVSYDVFKIQRGKDVAKSFSGLASALLSSSKLFNTHHAALVKAN